MEDLIYHDDEDLPEINIREVVPIEELVDDAPDFVALDDDFIEALAGDLLKNTNKGIEFLNLHKHALSINKRRSLVPYAKFVVEANRKKLLDGNQQQQDPDADADQAEAADSDDEGELLTKMETLRKASYQERNTEIARLMFPFESTNPDTVSKLHIAKNQVATIILENGDQSKYFGDDAIKLPIYSVKWSSLGWSQESLLADSSRYQSKAEVEAETDIEMRPTNDITSIEASEALLSEVAPKFDDLLKPLGVHELKVLLSVNGKDFEKLSHDELARVFETAMTADIDIDGTPLPGSSTYTFLKDFITFDKVIEKHLQRLEAYMTDSRKQSLLAMIDAYLASNPDANMMEGVPSPYDIVVALRSSTMTLEDVVAVLRSVRNKIHSRLVRELVDVYTQLDMERAQSLQDVLKTTSMQDVDFVRTVELPNYHEIHEIKMGADTTNYEGADVPEEPAPATTVDEDLDSDDEAAVAQEDVGIEDPVPSHPTIERSPDHFTSVFRDLKKVVDISRLPWDWEKWLNESFADFVFSPSRFATLKEISPIVADVVINNIASASTADQGLAEISRMSNQEEAQKLREAYKDVFVTWRKTCKTVFIDGLTFWALDTLSKSMSGTLNFKLPYNSYSHLWSPYGPPIESSKSTRGVFVYIAEISGIDVKVLLEYASKQYPNHVEAIKARKKSKRQDKVDDIQKEFLEALQANNKKRQDPDVFLKSYVPMYLNLPSLLARDKAFVKRQPAWAQGCCVAPLNKAYEGDIDFRYIDDKKKEDTSLYVVKWNLASKRWSRVPRQPMRLAISAATASSLAEDEHQPTIKITPAKLDANADSSRASIPSVDASSVLADIASREHIAAYKSGKGAFTAAIGEVTTEALPQKNLRDQLLAINASNLDNVCIINMIKLAIAKTLAFTDFDDALKADLLNVRERLSSENIDAELLKYILAYVITRVPYEFKAVITQHIALIRDASVIMTYQEVQEFINKKREEQKEVKRKKLDSLSLEDRAHAVYANKIGVVKYADLDVSHMAQDAEGQANEDDGEREFTMRPTDEDGDTEYYNF